jgi:membrane protein required for colicin V production
MGLGLTWLDWAVLLLVLAFAFRGMSRGLLAQIFALLGLAAGLWTAGFVSHWVAEQWRDGNPVFAFRLLRWLVTLAAALAAAALFHWLGEIVRAAAKATPAAWLDRSLGLVMGAALGTIVITFLLLGALLTPWPRALESAAAATRVARPAMAGGAHACSMASRYFAGSGWLRQRFLIAERRAEQARAF